MTNPALTLPAPGWLGPGLRVYAIGDIHGCAGRLAELHELIAADLHRTPVSQPVIIHVGDYIDRGPDSAAVVRRLAAGPVLPGIPTINLRGNHEQMMLNALAGEPADVWHWLDNGGDATLRSWGTSPARSVADWQRAVSVTEHAFLDALPLFHRIDGYVFVHAGLRPGIRLADQMPEDMLWIREGFLDRSDVTVLPEAPDVAVVHGHTPMPKPTLTGHSVGIDTGAVKGGKLTCAVLEARTVRFLSV